MDGPRDWNTKEMSQRKITPDNPVQLESKNSYEGTHLHRKNSLTNLQNQLTILKESKQGAEKAIKEGGMNFYTLIDIKWRSQSDPLNAAGRLREHGAITS